MGFLSSFFLQIPFPYLCFFPDFKFCFCSTSVFGFKECKFKKTHFFKKRGLQHNGVFFMNLCFAKCEKLSFFFGIFWGIFWLFFKTHYKNRHFSTFFEAKNYKKNGIFGSYYLVQVGSYYLVQVDCVLKNANLDQIITSKIIARNFFFKKKRAETPIFIVFFGNRCFRKKQTWTR